MADKDWTAGIPWVIAVVGWFVTHLFSEGRERRKENRGQIDTLYETLGELSRDAYGFHTAEDRDDGVAHDLLVKVRNLERQLSRVGCFYMDDFTPHIIQLRRAITYRNFDRSDFKTQPEESPILADISTAVEGVEDEMERQFRRAYSSPLSYFGVFGRRNGTKVRPK